MAAAVEHVHTCTWQQNSLVWHMTGQPCQAMRHSSTDADRCSAANQVVEQLPAVTWRRYSSCCKGCRANRA